MERSVSTKVSCTVWSRGKSGDHIKALPIAIGVERNCLLEIYRIQDYSVNEELFHWQSQSRTTEESITGQRYINQ